MKNLRKITFQFAVLRHSENTNTFPFDAVVGCISTKFFSLAAPEKHLSAALLLMSNWKLNPCIAPHLSLHTHTHTHTVHHRSKFSQTTNTLQSRPPAETLSKRHTCGLRCTISSARLYALLYSYFIRLAQADCYAHHRCVMCANA